jgi:shikimate kinase
MIAFEERKPWNCAKTLLLIGPGAAGKSWLGSELAPLLERELVDLDHEFRHRVGDISTFIRREGYANYKIRNSVLAAEIAAETVFPTLLVASSGFLTPDNPEPALRANLGLLEGGYSVCLLPSRDLERAVSIIVERQLTRPFARDRAGEEAVIRARYAVYLPLGDLVVFSTAASRDIANAIARRFSKGASLVPTTCSDA